VSLPFVLECSSKLKTGCPLLTFNRCRDRRDSLTDLSWGKWACTFWHKSIFFEFNRTCKCFSCNFLGLAVNQSPQGISCDIFEKLSTRVCRCLVIIPIPWLLLNWELSIVNFTGFWSFVVVKSSLTLRWSGLLSWKIKGYPLKILLERTSGLLNMEKFLFGISAFGVFQMILYKVFL
jgi:hypothetical protein